MIRPWSSSNASRRPTSTSTAPSWLDAAPGRGLPPCPRWEPHAICAVDERKAVVGMGRLVGDGRMYGFAVDVVVDPDAQRQGVGQGIMDALE
jgi:hypothetical protein